jgi:hypothetical protein
VEIYESEDAAKELKTQKGKSGLNVITINPEGEKFSRVYRVKGVTRSIVVGVLKVLDDYV